jgi:large-conductance mechanosensitive channel
LSKEKPTISEVLDANRFIVMAILGMPVIGMLIAAVLIIYKRSDNMIIALGVILFVSIQYIIMMFFFMKKVEAMAKNDTEKVVEPEDYEQEPLFDESPQLVAEEERVVPLKEGDN